MKRTLLCTVGLILLATCGLNGQSRQDRNPRISFLKKGHVSPYSGVLYDSTANAGLLQYRRDCKRIKSKYDSCYVWTLSARDTTRASMAIIKSEIEADKAARPWYEVITDRRFWIGAFAMLIFVVLIRTSIS